VVVRAGRLSCPLGALLQDLLDRRVVRPNGYGAAPAERNLVERRIREWCEWWCSLPW
jgi:hypothetical protein